jgi:hypothetical protein
MGVGFRASIQPTATLYLILLTYLQAKAEEIDLPFLQQDLDKILASMKIGTIAFAKLSCRYATSHGWMKLILKQSISTKGLTAP